MKTTRTRLLSLLLALAMVFTMLPVSALAAETDGKSTVVAKIGDNEYSTLADAISAANAGETIVLQCDAADVDLTISEDIILDLGGKTITDAYIIVSGKVTIKNGDISNTNEPYPIKVTGSGELTMEQVDLAASKSDRAIWLDGSSSVLHFNSGSLLATKGANNSNSKIYGVWVGEGATANINGGSITVDAGADATAVAIFGNYTNTVNVSGGRISTSGKTYSYAIWADGDVTVTGGEIVTNEKKYGYSSGITYGKNYAINSKGDVEISGGSITTNGPSGYLVNAGGSNQQVTITDVEFTSVLSEADKTTGGHSEPNLIYGSSVTATITGGEFNGVNEQLIKGTGSTLSVSGGSFDAIKDEYVETGATITVNGKEMTKTENGLEEAYVALIAGTDIKVTNLDDAFTEEVNPDQKSVIMLADCTQDVTIESGYYSFYLNGYTMTGTFKLDGGTVQFYGDLAGSQNGGPGSKIQNTGLDGKYPIWCENGNFNLGAVEVVATGENGTALYSDGSKLNVNGDVTVTGNVQTGLYGIISITDGTFNGSLIKGTDSSLEVVGGKFSAEPSAFMPNGYKATLTDGYYVVSAKEISLDDLATDSEGAYLISTAADVVTFRTLLNTTEGKNILSGKVFKLANDIDMTGVTLSAAGNDSKRFMGTFDGQNHTISNVNIQAGDASYVAFFGNISGATIKDLTLHNLTVVGGSYTAGLVGFTRNSTITNCAVTGNISITGTSHVGGIHGGGVVSITDCEVNGTGTISGTIDVGAISGLISEGSTTVTGNAVEGITVSGSGLVGGLIGRLIVGSAGLSVAENSLTDVSVVSSGESYAQNGLAVGCTQAANGKVTYEENAFTNSTLTVNGVASDVVYCNSNFDGTDYSDKVEVVVPAVAQVGEQEFTDLQSAFDAAQAGDTIVLLGDTSISGQNALDKLTGKTLDLNQKTLTVGGNSYFSDGTTTFKNGNIVVSGYASDAFFCGYTTAAVIVFDGVKITGDDYSTGCAVFNANQGKVEVKNSTVTLSGDATGGIFYGGQVVVDDAKISANDVCRGFTNAVATIQNGSEVTLSGTEGTSKLETGLNNSTVTIDGSVVTITNATKRAVRMHNNTLTLKNASTLTATGCAKDIVAYDESSAAVISKSDDSVINAVNEIVVHVAKIGETKYESLTEALNAVQAGQTITLLADCAETVHINKSGVAFIIDGQNVTYTGKIEINVGQNVTVKNIAFVHTGDAAHDFIANVGSPTGKNYNTTLLVEDCSFTGNGKDNTVAVRTIHPTSVTIKNCSGTGLHSFLQNTGGQKVEVWNVTITESKGGLAVGTTPSVTIRGCDITTRTYGIRLDATLDGNTTLNGNTVNAYIPVSVRKATAADYKLIVAGSASSYTATNADGVWCAICGTEYEEGVALNDPSGNVKITWNTDVLDQSGVYGAYEYPIIVAFSDGYTKGFASLTSAMNYGYSGGSQVKIIVNEDITESMSELSGNIVTENPNGVTIKNTIVDEWIYCSENFTIGEGVTYDATGYASGLFMYADNCVINGTVLTDCYYQRYDDTKLTINEPGSMTVKTESFHLRYTEGDGEAGIYIVGDNDDSTIGLNAAVIYFYQGCINAKDADIKVGTYWQTNTTDNEGSANLVLDNSNLVVTVNEHNMKATGNSTVTLTNGSSVSVAGGYEGVAVEMDETSSFTKNGNAVLAAKIGNVNYATLQAAIDAVEDGGTITLLRDVTVSGQLINQWYEGVYYEGDKSFTVDLGGFTLTNDSTVTDYLILIKNVGSKANEITFKNGVIEAASSAYCAICTSSGSTQQITINLEKVQVLGNNSNGSVIKVRGGTVLNVKDGTVITGEDSYLGIECIASTANIYDGVEIYMNGTTSYNGCLVGVGSNGTVNVYGGYGKGVAGGFIAMTSGGTINVSGGEWIADTDGVFSGNDNVLIAQSEAGAQSTVNVTGGTFSGGYNCYGDAVGDAQLVISGGSFDQDPTAYLAEGCVVTDNGNGTYGVVVDPAYGKVAKIGETYFATLTEALNAVQAGQTIQLLPGVTISEGEIALPTLTNVTILGAEGASLKDTTLAARVDPVSLVGLTIDGVVFDNSKILVVRWTNNCEFKDWVIKNCTFKNLTANNNEAPIHLNVGVNVALENLTFVNNTLDNLTGGQKSGIYGQYTGKIVIENNVFNNIAFRPYLIQLTSDDGVADELIVTGNTFSGSAAGRAQALTNNAEGADTVKLVVSENIFKDITNAQQICYWNFNPETTTADLSKNYYDIDVLVNPSRFYFNSAAADASDLVDMGVFPIYTELNGDGTIKTGSLVTAPYIMVTYSDGTVEYFDDMREAVPHTTNCPELEGATITLLQDMSGLGMRFMENGMVFDLNGHTYTLTGGTGSKGTETSGFQIRPEVTAAATIKNGTIKIAEGVNICWMFNSYATDFIVEDVTIDCTNMDWSYGESCYVHVSRPGDNTQLVGNTKIINFNSEVAGSAINVGGTMTIGENVVSGGAIELDAGATLTAPEGLDVITADGYKVVYENGVYTSKQCVAQIGDKKFESLTAAIAAAQDGDTIQLLPGTITEEVKPWLGDTTHASEKSITIVGADNFGTTLTGGLVLGYDDSGCRDHTITIEGIAFEGKGLVVAGQKTVIIRNNKFTNIEAACVSSGTANINAISVVGKNIEATVTGNVIDGAAVAGINLRNMKSAIVSGNTITNTKHNSITINTEVGTEGTTVKAENNILSNWGTGDDKGRAIRIAGGETVNVNGNVMTEENAPEEFVKITAASTVDASGNYWNGKNPTEEGIFAAYSDNGTAASALDPIAVLKNYYAAYENGLLTNWVELVAVTGTIELNTMSMSLEDVIYLNIYARFVNFDSSIDLSNNAGLLVWHEDPGSVEEAMSKLDEATKVPGAVASGTNYMVRTEGIPAAEWGDDVYMLVYAECGTSTIYAGSIVRSSPAAEAMWLKSDAKYKDVAIAMLNYGAAAQMEFGYKTGSLMNSELTEEEKALNWNAEWLIPVKAADSAKTANFVKSDKISFATDTLSLEGAINLNFYVNTTVGTVAESGILFWTEEIYDSVDVLTVENATKAELSKLSETQWFGQYLGIPAAKIDKTLYVCAYVVDEAGVTHYTQVFAESPVAYAEWFIENSNDANLVNCLKWLVKYGNEAKECFIK